MKLRLMGVAMLAAGGTMVAAISACSMSGANEPNGDSEHPTASVKLALQGGDFTGNSVRICGFRAPPDGKYRCNYTLSDLALGPTACPCFNFNAEGDPIDPATGEPLALDGLCPSSDFPASDWTFSYTLFQAPNCGGGQLNSETNNLLCYDVDNIGTRTNANRSIEALEPGENVNHILCVSETSRKTFEFQACGQLNTPTDPVGTTRLDCGCAPAGDGTCSCADAGTSLSASDLPAGCAFDPATCNVVCVAP